MLPGDGTTAFVLGTGPDLPVEALGRLNNYFTIGVNRIWRTGFVPTVSFWLDGGIYQENPDHFDRTLCVCDASVVARPKHIGLRLRVGGLPRFLNPNFLYHLPNTGAVAALWAVSLGCYPVVLLGMGCQDDGRDRQQLAAMRHALGAIKAAGYRPRGACFPTLWQWSDSLTEFDQNMQSYYLRPTDTGALVDGLREFYR